MKTVGHAADCFVRMLGIEDPEKVQLVRDAFISGALTATALIEEALTEEREDDADALIDEMELLGDDICRRLQIPMGPPLRN